MSTIICSNCGKDNHLQRECREPLTSYGLICYNDFSSQFNYDRNLTDFKIVMIRRKDTIGYVEFLRGKFNIQKEYYIIKLFDMMTKEEKDRILRIKDFDKLRNHLGMTKKNYIYKNEYDSAKIKFNFLIKNIITLDKNKVQNVNNKKKITFLEYLINKSKNTWDNTEWGIPKGRKHQKETNINCAVREFLEETGISKNDISVLINIKPLEEVYTSFNNVKYRHIYFFAKFLNKDTTLTFNQNNKNQVNEISAIEWFNNKEGIECLRPYYNEKKEIINKTFNILNQINNDCEIVSL
jgi:8-oxo-dGTP pyrophosphatase MutT (NUDIX family)